MPYPRALVHHCLFASEQEDEEEDTTISLTTMLAACASSVTPFYHPDSAGDKVFFDEEASRHAEILIKACGLDPRKATFADMEALNVRVECVPCSKRQRLGMGWRTALLHSLKKHYATDGGPITAHWSVVRDTDDLERIYTAEDHAHRYRWGVKILRCPVRGCKTQFVGNERESYGIDWHRAVAHKDLSCASNLSMVCGYPSAVRF
ncbi:uncharacterized protein SCHCODRAFT_02517496 [Schizophyllum commune H4-8]|uniref:Expressed protein n=1 Tax=Schizophyllum commune (strain H4-8 / FGSC 9210) TaxID=578458 RepID=D8QM31_SCHCM|nr:uncharacterized protein SCHCODRAFT_02517496 [Schizophyllum commune H4-8]KAI5886550.1 hypothetical protein SCHCODRAFT_02517496 [Schizophyllum commune H4-8]